MERTRKKMNVRKLTVIAVLGAVATVLMFLEFSIPIIPSFIKMDFSELPALIAAFAFGPVSGIAVCLIKNIVNLLFSTSFGVGSIANFLMGAVFVGVAGFIYQRGKNLKSAILGAVMGSLVMGGASLFINYYIVYPIYAQMMTMEKIMQAYQLINPNVDSLWQALLMFNLPFTVVKGFINVILTFLIYKKVSPLLKGTV